MVTIKSIRTVANSLIYNILTTKIQYIISKISEMNFTKNILLFAKKYIYIYI